MGRYKDTYPITFPILRGNSYSTDNEQDQVMYKLMYISCLLTVTGCNVTC